jgi:hypothetical protein
MNGQYKFMKLEILNHLPDGILQCQASELHQYLPGPCLINLKGQRDEALFISILLHGNEYTGWEAVKKLLAEYQDKLLPRSISLFIGNVNAARKGMRLLDNQHDYNRIWKLDGDSDEHKIAAQLLDELRIMKPVMAVDVHNNTGLNPHYACVNKLEKEFLHLATLFSRTVVYFICPDSVLSMALAKFCPSVTVECGKPEDSAGVEHAYNFLQACLHLDHFPHHDIKPQDIDVFHTVATVKVPGDIEIGFNDESADLCFIDNLDRLNFNELPAGTNLASTSIKGVPLHIKDEHGNDVTGKYIANIEGNLVTKTPLMPSMLTLDKKIIKQDCLCYLMERYPLYN